MAEGDEVLNDILAQVAQEQGYENCVITSNQISVVGVYASFLFQASILAPDRKTLQLFVKVAAAGKKMRRNLPLRIYNIECFAYNKLLKTYKELEENHNIPKEHRLVTPQFYASSEERLREAVVLEDLTESGYKMYDRLKSIDWEYASASVRNLAKFHALSIAWSVDDLTEFNSTNKISMTDHTDDIKAYMSTVLTDIAVKATREENKERLSNFVKKILEDKVHMVVAFQPLKRPVIAHCDYRPSNLMHRVNEDGTIDVVTLDYQTLQRGNPAIDLLTFIFTGSDKSFRDQHYKQTLDCYYTELCAALRRFGFDPNKIYPLEDFDYEVQKMLPAGLATALYRLVLVTVDEADAPQAGKDFDITEFAKIQPSALYTQRLNEIVDDFVEMGVL